jgi:predicted RNA-binding protein with PIN domain
MKILIDGYNLIMSSDFIQRGSEDIEKIRDELIGKLISYKAVKGYEIHVVFDGWRGGRPVEHRENLRGITVTFSKIGETADDVIKRILSQKGNEWLVVSSDNELAQFGKAHGSLVITSREFSEKLEFFFYSTMKGLSEDSDELVDTPKKSKKGNPHKLPKSERKRASKLKKL